MHDYIKPHVHDGNELLITEGRHPVVERHLGHVFVPNDVVLNASTHQVIILTGPNMGGKSTYLRQVALTVLMAQVGSFVPANRAKVPITGSTVMTQAPLMSCRRVICWPSCRWSWPCSVPGPRCPPDH